MKKLLLISLMIFYAFSCSNKNELPKGILSKEKMQDVLWDMTRVGEFLNDYVFVKDSTLDRTAESNKWYDKVYRIHKVSKKDFDRSYAYFREHPAILKEVMDSLSKKQVLGRDYYSKRYTSTADSLKKINTPNLEGARKRMADSLNKRKKIIKKPVDTQ